MALRSYETFLRVSAFHLGHRKIPTANVTLLPYTIALLFEAVIVAFCFFSRFRWRRRLLVISAPNDEDWAYSQQLSALSGQACNFGEWEALSSVPFHTTLFLLNYKMKHRSLAHSNVPQSRL